MVLILERVSYGKKEVPEDQREYVMKGTSGPVGTLKEWEATGLLVEIEE